MNYFNYYTEIEDAFVRRRGRHLLLSPLDWALIESWKGMGVPLHVALRGIEKSFDSYESKPRRRSVKTLFYCQEEVEAQFGEWLEMQRGAQQEPTGAEAAPGSNGDGAGKGEEVVGLPFPRATVAAHLAGGRAELKRARDARRARGAGGELSDDELAEVFSRASERLSELEKDFNAAARPDARQLEDALTDLERLIDRALVEHAGRDVLSSRRAAAEEQLRPYAARMERAVYEQTLANLLSKALREDFALPRLSLFYL
jgi:hypothetical protein